MVRSLKRVYAARESQDRIADSHAVEKPPDGFNVRINGPPQLGLVFVHPRDLVLREGFLDFSAGGWLSRGRPHLGVCRRLLGGCYRRGSRLLLGGGYLGGVCPLRGACHLRGGGYLRELHLGGGGTSPPGGGYLSIAWIKPSGSRARIPLSHRTFLAFLACGRGAQAACRLRALWLTALRDRRDEGQRGESRGPLLHHHRLVVH